MKEFDPNLLQRKILIISDRDDSYLESEKQAEKKYFETLFSQIAAYGVATKYVEVLNENELEATLTKYKKENTIIFNWCERFNFQDGTEKDVVKVYERLGFTYTGGDSKVLELVSNKFECVNKLITKGVKAPKSYLLNDKNFSEAVIPFPCKYIIKSNSLHASSGIFLDNVVTTKEQLHDVCKRMFSSLNTDVIVQQFIPGTEYTVVVWGNKDPQALPPLQVNYADPAKNIYTYTAKFERGTIEYKNSSYSLLTSKDSELMQKIQNTAVSAYKAVGMLDYARFDVRTQGEEVYVIDANANPYINVLGQDESCEVYRSTEQAGYNWGETILRICEFAYLRNEDSAGIRRF